MNEPLERDQGNSHQVVGPAPKCSVNPVMAVQPWPAKHAWFKIRRAEPPKRIASERVRDFEEVYSLLDETTVREQASRCIQCPEPLCRTGCPLANLIPDWLAPYSRWTLSGSSSAFTLDQQYAGDLFPRLSAGAAL